MCPSTEDIIVNEDRRAFIELRIAWINLKLNYDKQVDIPSAREDHVRFALSWVFKESSLGAMMDKGTRSRGR